MERILAKALGEEVSELAAEEKRLLLSRLLARLAHEIRNPLSSLDIHVQLLEEDIRQLIPAGEPKLSGRLEIIQGELHRLENLVKQFLRLAGPSALELAPVEPGQIIRHVTGLLQPEAEARRIEVVVNVEEGLPRVAGDGDQLIQALLNLVINALQAVGVGGRVEVRARGAGSVVVIEVQDSGPGIPPGDLRSIFEPYYTTKRDGTGIGLWIAQQIVLAHRGSIQASNSPGGGALFVISLPVDGRPKPHGQIEN